MEKKKHDLYVLFGEDAVNAILDGGISQMRKKVNKGISYNVVHYQFDTKAERDAYLLALDDVYGWFASTPINKTQYEKIKEL